MEGNRDEADRCIEIAIKAIAEGKIEKAEKFLLKAENLYPTQKGKDLLEKLKTSNIGGGKVPGSPGARRRTTATPNATSGTANNPEDVKHEPEYTQEQVEIVKKVKKCKDYYEVLGVTKESPDSDIKKAYKKLALQLHPDKNQAPGAIEAFKAVGNAVAVLTDPKKRKAYDLYGADEQRNVGRGGFDGDDRRADEFFRAHGFESEFTAEDMFNFFFGGGGMAGGGGLYQQQNVYMRQRRYHRAQNQQRDQQNGGYAALFNLLPIILLIMLSMMSSFFISDPIYNLTPSQKYSVARKTNSLKIPYYVKDNFHSEYQGSVKRLETSVEEEYINNLKHACFRERNYRETMLMKARNFGDRELFRKAQEINTPSCTSFHNLQSPRS